MNGFGLGIPHQVVSMLVHLGCSPPVDIHKTLGELRVEPALVASMANGLFNLRNRPLGLNDLTAETTVQDLIDLVTNRLHE